ncbi:MAG: DNA polymerase III subunit gamma/tau [Pseudomonadota bacterium]|nr:DNA polymerase III subunit gamma/tau [Pseudomonadota bacterium]
MAEEENKDNQYVILARKYRPQNFEDLLGQDALVQTLTNAIKNNRLHHAYILTGIRGVGKTSTARIIAKALNCTGLDGKGGPTVHPCGVCENCKAITAGRHIDVMELDAASRTGVDDIREILDGVRYKPTNARYKIYIIDEVHMLSKNAFNALLKTLEEPPSHVKFIFATTEIRKVPVTILSRCQRFDLQRLKIDELMTMFHKIISAENLKADEEALQLLARAADGSARDGTSLLDQAISLGVGNVKVDVVKNMIGLADRTQNFELFENLVAGNVDKVITLLQLQYKNGANPVTILQDLINITHLVAKTRIIPGSIDDPAVSEEEKDFAKRMSVSVSIAILSKIWQMMIKGISELQIAPLQIDALEMILIRIAYAASLPTPYELLNDVKKNSNLGQERPLPVFARQPQDVNNSPAAKPESAYSGQENTANGFKVLRTVDDFIRLLEESRKLLVLYAFKNDLSVEHFEDGFMKVTLSEKINPDYILNLHKILEEATGKSWKIEIIKGSLGQTISQKENAKTEEERRNIMEYPLVKAIMAEFKGAKIETLTRKIMENDDDETSSFGGEENELNYTDLNFDEE